MNAKILEWENEKKAKAKKKLSRNKVLIAYDFFNRFFVSLGRGYKNHKYF